MGQKGTWEPAIGRCRSFFEDTEITKERLKEINSLPKKQNKSEEMQKYNILWCRKYTYDGNGDWNILYSKDYFLYQNDMKVSNVECITVHT